MNNRFGEKKKKFQKIMFGACAALSRSLLKSDLLKSSMFFSLQCFIPSVQNMWLYQG
jgi:hypothetical protein